MKEIQEFGDYKITTLTELENNVKTIESQVRHSREYRGFLRYCKEDCNMKFSQTWKDIDFCENKLSLEIHHLITLYDLVMIIGADMLADLKPGEYLLSFDISKRVIQCHMYDLIPCVSLAISEHEMVHARLLALDPNNDNIHLGNYREFLKRYGIYLDPKYLEMYKYLGVDEKLIKELVNNEKN